MSSSAIQVFEHSILPLGKIFKPHHLKALLKLNEMHSFNYLEATVNGVRFKNYVGIVQVDNLVIEILPKIDKHEQDEEKWRSVLFNMLAVAKKVKIHHSDKANVQKRNRNLLDIYLQWFLDEVDVLLRKGLVKKYRIQTSNVYALKGKLEIAGHIRENLVQKERFYTSHQIYDKDHLIHQLLRAALNIVVKLSGQNYLAAQAGRIDLAFPDINSKNITSQHFDKVTLNRKTKSYSKALDIAKIIISNYAPKIQKGSENMIALLFDMNMLWEEYIYQSLRKQSGELNFKVSKQHKPLFIEGGYYLKPDIIININEKLTIIDTKWKIPNDRKASSDDLRQIYAYNRFWKAEKGILLYPSNKNDSIFYTYCDEDKSSQCGKAFLSILENGQLSTKIADEILKFFFKKKIDLESTNYYK